MYSKLNELKILIEARNEQLLKEENHALAVGDNNSYNYLKQMQLQCVAELRLIEHIKFGDDNSKFMIC